MYCNEYVCVFVCMCVSVTPRGADPTQDISFLVYLLPHFLLFYFFLFSFFPFFFSRSLYLL